MQSTKTMQNVHKYISCQVLWEFRMIASIRAETETLPTPIPMMPKTCEVQLSNSTWAMTSGPRSTTSSICRSPPLRQRRVRTIVHPKKQTCLGKQARRYEYLRPVTNSRQERKQIVPSDDGFLSAKDKS
jgi:hypothetical protein